MADVQRQRPNPMLLPLSSGRGKAVAMIKGGKTPCRLLRKPRVPAPIPVPHELPQPPETPMLRSLYGGSCHINSIVDFIRHSPELSIHPSVVSPPPPSELHPVLWPSIRNEQRRTAFILDPLYRDRTNMGTYVEGKDAKIYRQRALHALPARPIRLASQQLPLRGLALNQEAERYHPPPAFTLENFLVNVSEVDHLPLSTVKQVMFSRRNYKRVQDILSTELLPNQTGVQISQLELPDGLSCPPPRIPQYQLLLQMASLVKEEMALNTDVKLRAVIRPVRKYSPSRRIGAPAPKNEILLIEDTETDEYRERELPGIENIFHSFDGPFFQGFRRTGSPFDFALQENTIMPAELAILDSLMSGGQALSFKANFISEIPELEALVNTVVYLNMSFNCFTMLPSEVLNLTQLTVLKLRNNPLEVLPVDIGCLVNLHVLVLSFCLLTELPLSFYNLRELVHLDVAYNRIQNLHNGISNLVNLQELCLEGNNITSLPMGALRLSKLQRLNLNNNFTDPMFWAENSKSPPQRLMYLSALKFAHTGFQYNPAIRVPDYLKALIDDPDMCDCCKGPMYGPGLPVLRPVAKIFRLHNIPFMFSCCSSACKTEFMSSKEKLIELLYGVESDDNESESDLDIQNAL